MTDPIAPRGPLVAVGVPIVRVGAASLPELRALAEEKAPDPTVFEEHEPFYWRAIPSTGALDSYFTEMDTSTLKNFAAESAEGRAFQNSHRHDELPLGYSLTGRYTAAGDAGARVEADYYTLRNYEASGINTDHFINGVRAALIRDVSVGFSGGEWICSICGRDMMSDWDCWHFPGFVYDKSEADRASESQRAKKASKSEGVLCTALIRNAHLSEASAVYDGATPGAAIAKAYREIEAGRMTPDQAARMEQRYRMRLPAIPAQHAVGAPAKPQKEPAMEFEDQVRGLLGLDENADALDAVKMLKRSAANGEQAAVARDKLQASADRQVEAFRAAGAPESADAFEWAASELRRLNPLAADGVKFRASCVADALTEGKRAYGDKFAEETYKSVLTASGTPIETITRMRDDWKEAADEIFKNGRTTVNGDGERDQQGAPARKKVNASHYGGGR